MRRLILAVTLTFVSAMLAFAWAPLPGRAQSPTVSVTPARGSQFDTFTFTGSGFAPGTELTETYISPEGEEFTFFIGGQPAVVVAGPNGRFSVAVRPSTDFDGARAGRWTVAFCIVGTDDCWEGTIDIAACTRSSNARFRSGLASSFTPNGALTPLCRRRAAPTRRGSILSGCLTT